MTIGTLKDGEYHPAADGAFRYIKSKPVDELLLLQESFASCAIEGNRLAEICSETLDRIMTGQAVSDRYLLGLAWTLKQMGEGLQMNDNTKHLLWSECHLVVNSPDLLRYCRRLMREAKDRNLCRYVDNIIWYTLFEMELSFREKKEKIKIVRGD